MNKRLKKVYELLEENGFSLAINTNNCSSIKERLSSAPSDNVILTSMDMIRNSEYFADIVEQIHGDEDDTLDFDSSNEFYKEERITDVLFAYYDMSLTMSISVEKKGNSNRAIIVTYNSYTCKYSRLVYDFWENISLDENYDEILGFVEVELESEIEKARRIKQERSLGLKRA